MVFLVVAALSQGCKKTDATKQYMTGSLKSLNLPTYVSVGYSKTFSVDTMMTLTRSDGGVVGYYYKDPVTNLYDTLYTADGVYKSHLFTITAPDSIATFSMTFGAYAKDSYYGSSETGSFTVVKPGVDGKGSLTNYSISSEDKQFTDPRDGKKYYYRDIDGTSWMKQNLAWSGAGKAFFDCDAMSEVFGRFYTWEEAQHACPDGWRLPDDNDWVALGKKYGTSAPAHDDIIGLAGDVMGDIYFNGTKMWEYWRDVKITDKAGLSIIPVGYATVGAGEYSFDSIYNYSALWTSESTGDYGVFRYIYADKDVVYYGGASKTDFAASVRCVKK